MKFAQQCLVLAMFAICSSGASAQTPDLVGTWTGNAVVALETENGIVETPRILSIVVEEMHGNQLRGYRTWKSTEGVDPGYVGDQPTTGASEPFIGTVSSDGDTLRLVETEDRGILLGEVLGPNEIELTYLETAPHPVAYTAIYRREP